ncbi:MAG: ParB-like protein partition protein [uncultured bacterium]|nr:MAG: ParB-like protein partition protein [uncultured bacterium]
MVNKDKHSKNVLGKGLSALIPAGAMKSTKTEAKKTTGDSIQEIEVSRIKANEFQPRVMFDKEKLDELAESIKQDGIIQPIKVQENGDGGYKIIFGERRFRAAKLAGMKTIPAIIVEASKERSHIMALIENTQREDLNAIEEAEAYSRILNESKITQDELAKRVGKSRSAIANTVRLLKLPSTIQTFVIEKKLSMGHVRCLLAIENEHSQIDFAKKAIEEDLSVRELENLVADKDAKPAKSEDNKSSKESNKKEDAVHDNSDIEHIINKIREKFYCKVCLKGDQKKGVLNFEYHSEEDLHRIFELLGVVEN